LCFSRLLGLFRSFFDGFGKGCLKNG
jgi:hypothetical protein